MGRSKPREETLEGSSGQQFQPSLVFESHQSRPQTQEGRCAQMSLGPRGSNLLAEAPNITEDKPSSVCLRFRPTGSKSKTKWLFNTRKFWNALLPSDKR